MFTPYQPGGEEALENTVQAFIASISQGQGDYTIVEQSSSPPRDAEVRAFIVEGSDAELGRVQGHMLFALSNSNAGAIMISWTGEEDSEKNMQLFDEMQQSFRFKE